MQKYVGYVFSIAGLVVMALGFGAFKLDFAFLNIIKPQMITALGVGLIVVGVVILTKFSRSGPSAKHVQPEVPIYQGDKIIGYRRA